MLKGGDTAGASVNVSCDSFRIEPTAGGDDKFSAGRSTTPRDTPVSSASAEYCSVQPGAPGLLAHKGQTESQFGPKLQFESEFQFAPYTIITLPRELSDRTPSKSRYTVFTLRTPT